MRQDEAIELAYALAAKAAEAAGVRALAIKGLVGDAHGLRGNRTPSDVDVLIEPDGFTVFTRQLQEWDWRSRYGGLEDFPVAGHSVTYLHEQWPCDIDAHHRFPGFLAPPQQVFDALWERRQLLSVADRLVPMTDWASSVAIMALHSVRSTPDNARHADELRHLIEVSPSWTKQQRSELAALARATGCAQSLDVVWRRLGVLIDLADRTVASDDLAEWRLKLDARVPSTRVWLRYLRGGGTRQLLTRARTMLWPPADLMSVSHRIDGGKLALTRARLARIARGLRKAPRSLLAIARGGENVTRNALDSSQQQG